MVEAIICLGHRFLQSYCDWRESVVARAQHDSSADDIGNEIWHHVRGEGFGQSGLLRSILNVYRNCHPVVDTSFQILPAAGQASAARLGGSWIFLCENQCKHEFSLLLKSVQSYGWISSPSDFTAH